MTTTPASRTDLLLDPDFWRAAGLRALDALSQPGAWTSVIPLVQSHDPRERAAGCRLSGLMIALCAHMTPADVARRALQAPARGPDPGNGTALGQTA